MSKELITIIRPSFMKFCQDGCKAAAFNHLLYWIARKGKSEPQEKIQSGEVMWYATTEEITEGMSNAWGVCKVRKEVNEIIDMGIIGRSKNPKWGADRTKHFFFGPDQCEKLLSLFQQHAICIDCLDLPSEITQMINLSNANDKSMICKCVKHQMQVINLSDAIDKSIEAIPKDSTKVTSKVTNKEEESASLSSPALSVWNKWCEAQGYEVKGNWTKAEQAHCETLAKMDIDLTPKLMNDAREWAQEKQSFLKNKWGLKNLINALPDYLKDMQASAPQPTIAELPELTEQEASEKVLWTEHPDGVYALRGTIEQMAEAGIIKWMSHEKARANGYDMPGMFHFDAQEIAEYEQWASERMAIAG